MVKKAPCNLCGGGAASAGALGNSLGPILFARKVDRKASAHRKCNSKTCRECGKAAARSLLLLRGRGRSRRVLGKTGGAKPRGPASVLPMPKGAGSASAMAAEASPSPSLHHLQHRPVQPQQSQTLSLQSHMQAQQHCAQHMQPMGAAAGGYDAGGCMHMQGLNDRVGMSTDSAFGSVQAAGLSTGRSMELGEAMESSPMKQQASRHMHSFATSGSLPCTSCQGPSLAPTPSVTTAAASLMTRQQLVTALAHEQAQREASERACAELSARLQAAEERVGTLLARMNMPGPSCPRISGEEVLERLSDMLDVCPSLKPHTALLMGLVRALDEGSIKQKTAPYTVVSGIVSSSSKRCMAGG